MRVKKTGIAKVPRKVLSEKWGDLNDIMALVIKVCEDENLTKQVAVFAFPFKGQGFNDQYRKLENLHGWVRRNIRYRKDTPPYQDVKHPAALWREKVGDCKSMTVFIFHVCRAIGVKCKIRFASYNPEKEVQHVYPVAILAGEEIPIDAVISTFDDEETATKTIDKMPKIREIAGVGNAQKATPPTTREMAQRAKNVRPLAAIDTAYLSEGEMELLLLAQRAKMVGEFWQGEPQGKAATDVYLKMRDVLYKGLHTTSGLGYLRSKHKTRPASGYFTWQQKPRTPEKGIKNLFDDAPAIGEITQLDCETLFPLLTEAQLQAQGVPASLHTGIIIDRKNKRDACELENEWRKGLNDFWADSGHSMLYEFLDYSFGNVPQIVGQKQGRHIDFITTISKSSKISRSNLKLWAENGIIHNNIIGANGQSLGPVSPKEFIQTYRDAAAQGIGFPFALIPVAIAVSVISFKGMQRFLAVVSGKQKLKDAVVAHVIKIEEFIQEHGNKLLMQAGLEDWKIPDFSNPPPTVPPSTEPETNKFLLPALIVGGGILLSR